MRCPIMQRSQRTQRSVFRNVSPSSSLSSPPKVSYPPVSLSLCVAIYSFHLLRWTTRCIQAWLMRCVAWLGGFVVYWGLVVVCLFICCCCEERPWMAGFVSRILTCVCSIRKMPPGETKNSQRRRHYIRNDLPRLRKLRRSPQNLPRKVPSGIPPTSLPPYYHHT